MAIISMQKVRILAMLSDRAKIMELLMNQGMTQIEDVSIEEIEVNYAKSFTKDTDDGVVASLDSQIKISKEAIDIIDKFVVIKKGLFAAKRQVSVEDYNTVVNAPEALLDISKELIDLQRKLGSIISEKNRITSDILSMERWSKLPFSTDFKGS